jgi:hypothetical protein
MWLASDRHRENNPGRDDALAILHHMTQCQIQLLGEMRRSSNIVFSAAPTV